jgi:FkbM family methyltransferase
MTSAVQRRNDRDDRALIAHMKRTLRADSVVVDIGAHVGTFTAAAVRFAPDGAHIAVEPIPEMAELLRDRFPSVTVHQVAVSDARGEARFHHDVDQPAFSGLERRDGTAGDEIEALTVRVTTVDDLVPTACAPALLKVDIEGAELDALRGAERVLADHHPDVALEWGESGLAYGATHQMLHELLGRHGYRLYDMTGNGPYSVADMSSARVWNFLALADSRRR